ncbi:MAG: cyclic nucleotide-binding domain-containing protein [Spirochaetia bacterium]|nr:cyclic nucleotide-binding domain-containing protein [Spirochaetia bacterium]
MPTVLDENILKYIAYHSLEKILTPNIVPYLTLKKYHNNDVLMHEEDQLESLYFVVEGKTKVCPCAVDGKVALLETVEALDLLGDIEFETNNKVFHTVISINDSICILVPYHIVSKYLYNNNDFLRFFCHILGSKVSSMSVKHSSFILDPLKVRVAKYLLKEKLKTQGNSIKILNSDLADSLGVTTRQTRRILKDFEDESIILKDNQIVDIINLKRMEEISSRDLDF